MNFETRCNEALLSAFANVDDLRIVAQQVLNEPLQNITSMAKDMRTVVFDLIVWLKSRGRLTEFLQGAYRNVPGNAKLRAVAWESTIAASDLLDFLVHNYPDPHRARDVAEKAGLQTESLDLNAPLNSVWMDILRQAWDTPTRLEDIARVAQQDYPEIDFLTPVRKQVDKGADDRGRGLEPDDQHDTVADEDELPDLQRLEDGGFLVRDEKGDLHRFSEHILSLSALLPPEAMVQISHWKRIHTLTENMYREYMNYQQFIKSCEIALESRNNINASNYLYKSNIYLKVIGPRLTYFHDQLSKLPKSVRGTPLVTQLMDISICIVPLRRCLGTTLGGESFKCAVALSRAIGNWLLDGLHIADRVLEAYFDARKRKRKEQ